MTRSPKSTSVGPKHAKALPVEVPIADLVVNPRNPRVHPEEQLERLMASLAKDGQTKPILVRAANNMIIAGHGVTEAARRSGWTAISAMLWDIDQATADRIMLADNQFSDLSTTDKDRVAELLGEIDQADFMATGWNDDEVAKLMASFDEGIEVVEIETTTVADDFWVTCRGPLGQQALVLALIKEMLAAYPEVTVELGVITGA